MKVLEIRKTCVDFWVKYQGEDQIGRECPFLPHLGQNFEHVMLLWPQLRFERIPGPDWQMKILKGGVTLT